MAWSATVVYPNVSLGATSTSPEFGTVNHTYRPLMRVCEGDNYQLRTCCLQMLESGTTARPGARRIIDLSCHANVTLGSGFAGPISYPVKLAAG